MARNLFKGSEQDETNSTMHGAMRAHNPAQTDSERFRTAFGRPKGILIPTVLKATIKIKIRFPSDPGRHRPNALDFPRKMTVWTLPRTPRGSGDKNKIKNVFKYR